MYGDIAAKIYRGENIESIHRASIAVVDENGKLIYKFGDPEALTMSRSSIKSFQVLPLLISGAFDEYGFDEKQLSIMCGSHNGSDMHREVVLSILEKIGLSLENLKCGTQLPLHMRLTGEYPSKGEDKDPSRHNCSGKHAGFLAMAKYLGEDLTTYIDFDCKTQTQARESVENMIEAKIDFKSIAIDGCSAPNFPISTISLARGFQKLAAGVGWDEASTKAVNRVQKAMLNHPELFSGQKRFDLDLMKALPGNVVCKVGAEGIEGIGLIDQKIGIAVKVDDGNPRALYPICVEVLRQLSVANPEENDYLKGYVNQEIKNYRSLVTGQIEVDFKLQKV